MVDKTPKELGQYLCQLNEYVKTYPENWEHIVDKSSDMFRAWLIHPLNRNWALIDDLKVLTCGIDILKDFGKK